MKIEEIQKEIESINEESGFGEILIIIQDYDIIRIEKTIKKKIK